MVKIVVPAGRMDQERGCDRDGVEKWIRMTGRWCGRASCLWSLHLCRATVGHVTWRRGRQVVDCGGWPAGYGKIRKVQFVVH